MPLLRITANYFADSLDKNAVVKQFSSGVADILGKPESYVMVVLDENQTMSFAGSQDPMAYIELKSLGLPDDRTTEFSQKLCALSETLLNISPSRIYIEFSSPQRHHWGWDNRTF